MEATMGLSLEKGASDHSKFSHKSNSDDFSAGFSLFVTDTGSKEGPSAADEGVQLAAVTPAEPPIRCLWIDEDQISVWTANKTKQNKNMESDISRMDPNHIWRLFRSD